MEDIDVIEFKSSKETARQRQWEKEARQDILDRAKSDYDRRQAKEEAARQRGETTWMLPSVEAKLGSEKSSKKKKKKEKKKKKKKSKKSKKNDSSSSSSESEEENSWVERPLSGAANNGSTSQPVQDGRIATVQQPPKRDNWMEMTSLFGTYTKEEMNICDGTSRKVAKEEEERKKKEKDKPGSHALELNPYYANGGTGLPEEQQKISDKPQVKESSSSMFDAQWLRRALKRAEEQAKDQGKSLEEVAAHRWGSLEKFYELLDEAEGKGKTSKDANIPKNRSRSGDKGSIKKDKSRNNNDRRSRSRDRSTSRDRRRHSRSRSRDRKRYGRSKRSRSKEALKTNKQSRSRSKERSDRGNKNRRNRSSSSSSRSRSRSRSREKYSSAKSEHKGLMKPSDDQSPKRSTSLFMKPEEDHTKSSKGKASMARNFTQNRGWQKKEFRPSQTQKKSQSSSSSSSSDSEDEKPKPAEECEAQINSEVKIAETETEKPSAPTPIFLNDKQMNELAAKIMKAEMLGNDSQAAKLKTKMEAARAARASGPPPSAVDGQTSTKREEEVVLLTKTDAKGNVRPVSTTESDNYGKKKIKKVKTHGKDGNRDRYFPDDDKYDLKSMFQKEKGTSAEEQNSLYERAIAKNHEKLDDDFDVDDMFMDKATQREGDSAKQMEMEQKKAIKEHQRTQRSLENCQWCFDSKDSLKHLIVALGSKAYLTLPAHESLTPGHCIIVPIQHTQCTVQADEDIWGDVQLFRKSLVRLFESRGEDCIFFEMARGFRNLPHMTIHCIPLPKETGDMAPIYFKKAIMECEGEWAQNKKLVELKGRDVRRAIPKGLPYFFVDFAMMDGYAHVIEDEQTFPRYFAQEIVGGMLDVETNLWRKPRRENFDTQRRKVMQFSTWYKDFDPTQS